MTRNPSLRPDDTAPAAPTCIFCDRPSTSASYAWPDWLCRFVMERHSEWITEGTMPVDLELFGRMEREVDTTVTRVCDTCAHGWIDRLENNARPLLESMIAGHPTPLPTARRKLLARWAAKTAFVMECATDAQVRTPRFAREHLRKVGVHPGTQVLAGKYDGQDRILSHERDLYSTTIDGEKRFASQTSFVIGRLLLQVFAAPWEDTVPELSESAAEPFIPLLGGHDRNASWPPAISIDDRRYDLAREGSGAEAPAVAVAAAGAAATAHQQGRDTTMTRDGMTTDGTTRDGPLPEEQDDTEAVETERAWHSASVLPDVGPAAAPATAPIVATPFDFDHDAPRADSGTNHESLPLTMDDAELEPDPPDRQSRLRARRRLAGAALMFVVLGAVFAWGLNQRSEANRWRSRTMSAQARAHARTVQLRTKALQARANAATIAQLNDNISALAADRTNAKNRPAQLRRMVGAVPAVSDGVRHCANAAFETVSDALDFAANYPDVTSKALNGDSVTVSKACGEAGAAANTLEGLAASPPP